VNRRVFRARRNERRVDAAVTVDGSDKKRSVT